MFKGKTSCLGRFGKWTSCLNATLSILLCFFFLFLLSVNRRGHDVLRDQLPSKQEHVILVRLSPIQRALYTEFMKRFREAGNTGWLGLNPLKAFCVCCKVRRVYIHPSSNQFFSYGNILSLWKFNQTLFNQRYFHFLFQIWNHPDVLYEALQKESQTNEQDLDLDDITSAGNPRCPAPGAGLKAKVADPCNSKNNATLPINHTQDRANQVITYEWVRLV